MLQPQKDPILRHRKAGFSLLELSVVLAIVGIMLASGLTLTGARLEQAALEQTHDEMTIIDTAISNFLKENGRLPCPASATLLPGNALYGREAADCSDATPPTGIIRVQYPAASGRYVRIGVLPFYSLQIKEEYLDDSWRYRYLYAVSESAITTLSTADEGNIRVVDSAGNSISDSVAYVLLSHGATHAGGYNGRSGSLPQACNSPSTTLDGENCDGDGIFVDAPYNDGVVAASFFDDIIHWKTRMRLYSALIVSGESSSFKPWKKGQAMDSDDSGYALEIKGVTTVNFDGNDGYAAYSNQCDTDYPGSWFLRSSDLPYIADLPAIPTPSRIHIDTCDHLENASAKYCYLTFSKATGGMPKYHGSSNIYGDVDNLNCVNWTSNAGTSFSIAVERNNATTNFREVSGTDTNGLDVTSLACDTTAPFICVGEK